MRTQATVLSFFLVLAVYFLYGWVLVPLVLPDISKQARLDIRDIDNFTRGEIAPLLELFPEDGWERDTSSEIFLLQSKQTIVLFQESIIDGRMLRLEPCTLLLLPDGLQNYRHNDDETRKKINEIVVLRTPLFAEIELDSDFDIGKMTHPNFVTGRLWGKVSVQGGMQNNGNPNFFYLETENVEIKEDGDSIHISTLKDVDFLFGLHSGEGSGLTLSIKQSNPADQQSRKELEIAVVRKLKSLHLVFPDYTLDVRCQDRFIFAGNQTNNAAAIPNGWTASFFQDVEILRNIPGQLPDKLTAEEVHLTLANDSQAAQTSTGLYRREVSEPLQFDRLEPALFIARGKPGDGHQPPVPARLSVQQNGEITLVGDEIFLDLQQNFLHLSTRNEAGASPFVEMILGNPHGGAQYSIRSEQRIRYTFGQDGGIGRFAADGKGHVLGKIGEGTTAKDIRLDWNEMQMGPHPTVPDHIVLQLDKGITANVSGIGTMTARQLELHCVVTPTSRETGRQMIADRNNVLLDQISVRDNVLFQTASGTCRVRQMHIFFRNLAPDGTELHSSRMLPTFAAAPTVPLMYDVDRRASAIAQSASPGQIVQVQLVQPVGDAVRPHYQQPASHVAAPHRIEVPHQVRPRSSLNNQNLMGIHSSAGNGKFDITGDSMRMGVRVQNGLSFAERVAIAGNVHLKESLENSSGKPADISANLLVGGPTAAARADTLQRDAMQRDAMPIEIRGESVTIWNPADSTTKIQILGRTDGNNAMIKGRGVEMRANELNLSREDNIFWSPGPGQLIAYMPPQLNAGGQPATALPHSKTTDSNEDHLKVTWDKAMRCNGKVVLFEGLTEPNNSRVSVSYQTSQIWCNNMLMLLNRQVMFFDDSSGVNPDVVEIECVGDVRIRHQHRDALGQQLSLTFARSAWLRYNVERDYFFAHGPGELNSVLIGPGRGFGALPADSRLNNLAVWFSDMMQGTFSGGQKKVDITGRKVEVAYCPTDSWDDRITINTLSSARQRGYTMTCERLEIEESRNPVNMPQSFFNLTASNSAIIEGSGIFGKAHTIKYNESGNTVELEGNVTLHNTVQGQPIRQNGDLLIYNIKTNSVEFQTQGLRMQ